MTSETAELAIAPEASGLPGVRALDPTRATVGDPARARALRDSWRALWSSRLFVWAVGIATLATYGFGPVRHAFNPPGLTRGFGWLGDLLAAPAARWDSAWYLVIAHYGYRPDLGAFTASREAFFPLYPLGLRGLGWLGVPLIVAGVAISLAALWAALYGIHRLTTLEFGGSISARGAGALGGADTARLAVLLTAFAPMAFFLSAVYSEALYLALSVGVFYAARRGRFALVGVLAGLAGATRSTGVVLLLPALILYLYGPREDGPPDRPTPAWSGSASGSPRGAAFRRLAPRYRLRKDALWLALAPAGLLGYVLYLGAAGGDPLAPFHAQDVWGRHFAGPYLGIWDGVQAAFEGARQLLSMQQGHLYFQTGGEGAFVAAGHNLLLVGFLLAGLLATAGVVRRLPAAYGAYVIAALALPLSYPVTAQPLMSLPRFLVVLFPLNIWGALWLAERPRLHRPALVLSGTLLAFFLAQFATWHWVA